MVVNEVELTGALEYMGDVEHLPYLGVDGGVLGIGRRADTGQAAGRPAILRGKQGDVPRATSASVNRLVTNSHGP
jgi:hypothetical protein